MQGVLDLAFDMSSGPLPPPNGGFPTEASLAEAETWLLSDFSWDPRLLVSLPRPQEVEAAPAASAERLARRRGARSLTCAVAGCDGPRAGNGKYTVCQVHKTSLSFQLLAGGPQLRFCSTVLISIGPFA